MKKTLLIAVLLCVFGTNAMAQDSQSKIKGAQASQYVATELKNDAKLFAVPLVANLEIIKGAKTTYTTTYTHEMPAPLKFPKMKAKKKRDKIAYEKMINDRREKYIEEVRKGIEDSFNEAKAMALFEFSEQTKADVIVSPIFSITTDESDGTKIVYKVKVKGYPARYSDFRSLAASDSTLIKLNNRIQKNVNNVIEIGGNTTSSDEKTTNTTTNIK